MAFTEAERERITAALKASGRRLFATAGLRKTSLAALVADAGIVKSTFYAFFESKEALYLHLLLEQAEETRRRTIDEGLHAGTDARDALRRFLRAAVGILSTDPLYRRLVTHPDELAMVVAKVGPETARPPGENPAPVDFVDDLTTYIAERQRAGAVTGTDPAVVVGALRTVLLVPLHADEFGEAYPAVLDLTIDALTAGLAPGTARA
ncbi:TetR/AcrR family transcriptional regulator [Myceligenerans xiligouense]|uniref:TetR/AcrR family transcriptional regulator n=1 Tax=Myceligenerans xiligouense TaxID=253184 RepID=UPI001B88192C|nr:TetR/AcrR family transcriptional regulator [Myceligenerans xiligouense]